MPQQERKSLRRLVLYSDFNCPFCYAMHERLHARGLIKNIEWRGVQHAPHLPVPMARWNGRLMDELRQEVAMVRRLAPDLPIALPSGKPNTKAAIHAAVRVLALDPALGEQLVLRLYQTFWREGRDISDPLVLSELLRSLSIDEQDCLTREDVSASVVKGWNEDWRSTGQFGVPLLIREDGMLLIGLASETDLDRFLNHSD